MTLLFSIDSEPIEEVSATTPQGVCECDFEPAEGDGDVDGSDLSTYAEGGIGISLVDFAAEFGRTNCPVSR